DLLRIYLEDLFESDSIDPPIDPPIDPGRSSNPQLLISSNVVTMTCHYDDRLRQARGDPHRRLGARRFRGRIVPHELAARDQFTASAAGAQPGAGARLVGSRAADHRRPAAASRVGIRPAR